MTAPRTAVGEAGRDGEGDRTKQLLSPRPLQHPRGGRSARLPASMSVFPLVPSRLALLGIAQPRSNNTYRPAGALSPASACSCPQPGIYPPHYLLQRGGGVGGVEVISATPFPTSGLLCRSHREVRRSPAPAPQRPGGEAGAATRTYQHKTLQQDRSGRGVKKERKKGSSKKRPSEMPPASLRSPPGEPPRRGRVGASSHREESPQPLRLCCIIFTPVCFPAGPASLNHPLNMYLKR